MRTFSHGCIRLDDPYEFGKALLTLDGNADPSGTFDGHLNFGENRRLNLNQPLPVHLVYRTAVSKPVGGMECRDDIYGRDARILQALLAMGIQMPWGEMQVTDWRGAAALPLVAPGHPPQGSTVM